MLELIFDYTLSGMFLAFFGLLAWGLYVEAKDEQRKWEERKEADKKEIERNDSSRIL